MDNRIQIKYINFITNPQATMEFMKDYHFYIFHVWIEKKIQSSFMIIHTNKNLISKLKLLNLDLMKNPFGISSLLIIFMDKSHKYNKQVSCPCWKILSNLFKLVILHYVRSQSLKTTN